MSNRFVDAFMKPFGQKPVEKVSVVSTGVREVFPQAVNLIIKFEKMHRVGKDGRVYPYYDAVGFPTIGVGHLLSQIPYGNPKSPMYKGRTVGEIKELMQRQLDTYESMSMSEAKELLNRDLDKYASGVSRLCKIPLHDYQFGALVSFAFNVGLGNLKASTLLRMLNRGDSLDDVSEQFLRWNKAGGIVLRGLTIRREAERQMFLGNYGN